MSSQDNSNFPSKDGFLITGGNFMVTGTKEYVFIRFRTTAICSEIEKVWAFLIKYVCELNPKFYSEKISRKVIPNRTYAVTKHLR